MTTQIGTAEYRPAHPSDHDGERVEVWRDEDGILCAHFDNGDATDVLPDELVDVDLRRGER